MTEVLENYALDKKKQKQGTIKKVGIIGCGSMGQEIARLVSQTGVEVVFIEVSEARINTVFDEMDHNLDDMINKWGLTKSDKRAVLSRISGSLDYNDLKDCDMVIETINYAQPGTSVEIRKEIFRKVEAVVCHDCIIASNTATLMISDLANVLEHPSRAVGLHFVAPITTSDVIEVVKGVKTNQQSFDIAFRFVKMIGKRMISMQESPGNISTRLLVTMINEACDVLMEGISTVTCIDQTMKRGFGLRFGPFELADRIGMDKLVKWMENLYEEFGDQKYKPNPIIKRLNRSGYIGVKTAHGFYRYHDEKIIGETIHSAEVQ